MEGMSWTPRGELTLSDELLKKADRDRLSASTAAGFMECPARTAAEKALPWKSSSLGAAELGTAAHATVELLYEQPADQRTRQDARSFVNEVYRRTAYGHKPSGTWADKKLTEGTPTEVADLERQWKSEVWKRVRGLWQIEEPAEVKVIRNEWAINVPLKKGEKPSAKHERVEIAGVAFTGFIDRTELVPETDEHDEGVMATDYKAGNIAKYNPRWTDSHGEQLRLYFLALEAMGEDVVAAQVAYIRHGARRSIDVSDPALESTEERFKKAWTALRTSVADNKFVARPSGLCPWCPLVAGCPKARDAGRAVSESVNGDKIILPTIRRRAKGESTKPKAAAFASRTPGGDAPVAVPFGEAEPVVPEPAEVEPTIEPDTDIITGALNHDPSDEPTDDRSASVVTPSDHDGGTNTNGLRPPMVDGDDYTDHIGREIGAGDMEGKPWELTNDDDSLNPNSYAAQGLSGLTAKSMKMLKQNGQKLSKNSILALAQTFSLIVEEVQLSETDSTNLQAGANTRIRGFLFATMETFPPPFAITIPPSGRARKPRMEVYGEQVDAKFDHDQAWADWVESTIRRTAMLYQTFIQLYEDDLPDEPWGDLLPTDDEMSNVAAIRKAPAKKAAAEPDEDDGDPDDDGDDVDPDEGD